MIFSNKVSKFGKGLNLSAFMPTSSSIIVYYYNGGIHKKTFSISNNTYTLSSTMAQLPYNQVIQIQDNCLVTRLNKSLGIQIDEQ